MLKKIGHTVLTLLLIGFFEIFIANHNFAASIFIGTKYTPFNVSVKRVILYILILVLVFFYDEIKKNFTYTNTKLEKKFFKDESNYHEFKFEKLFLTLGLAFGILFVFLVPPLNSSDETLHFLRAYWLAQGHWFPTVNANGSPCVSASTEINKFLTLWPGKTMTGIVQKTDKANFFNSFMQTMAPNISYTNYDYASTQVSPLLYFPQAFGMLVGRFLFHFFDKSLYSGYTQLIFARIFNLLFYIVMTYQAIKISPVFKRTFTIIALMPTTLFMASSCNYDVFVYSFCFMFIAYIFKCAYDPDVDKIRKKQIIILAFLFAMVSVAKYAYFPIVLLLIIIPREKFDNNNLIKRFGSLFIVLCSGIFFVVLCNIIYKLGVPQKVIDANAANENLQMKFILNNPLKYTLILFYSLLKHKMIYTKDFVANLGWYTTNLPIALTVCYMTLIVISSLLEKCSHKVSVLHRFVIAFAGYACYALSATAMYVYFSSLSYIGGLGSSNISGVQGRYFIPFAVCICFVFANRLSSKMRLFEKIHYGLNNCIAPVLTSSLAVTTFVIFVRYWVN